MELAQIRKWSKLLKTIEVSLQNMGPIVSISASSFEHPHTQRRGKETEAISDK